MTALALTGCAGPVAADPRRSVTVLADPVELEVRQAGFAGETGWKASIGRDGTFSVERLGEARPGAPRAGRVPARRLAALARALAGARLGELPPRLGQPPPVNPRHVTIREGAREVTLALPPGSTADGPSASAAEARFRSAWAAITAALGDSAPRE